MVQVNLYTLRSCFCRVLTSNWKVSTGRSPQSFITFIQTTQNFVIICILNTLKQIFQLEKHTLRVLYEILKRLFQNLFRRLIYVFVFICCISCHFLTIYAVAHLSRIHLRVTDQTQQTGPNEFASHFEVVFVVC